MTSRQSKDLNSGSESNPYSYQFSADEHPASSPDPDADDLDRPMSAAAVIGAVEANVVCFFVAFLRFAFSGGLVPSLGLVGSIMEGLYVALAVVLVFFIPLGICGAFVGMFANLFSRRSRWRLHLMLLSIFSVVFGAMDVDW